MPMKKHYHIHFSEIYSKDAIVEANSIEEAKEILQLDLDKFLVYSPKYADIEINSIEEIGRPLLVVPND